MILLLNGCSFAELNDDGDSFFIFEYALDSYAHDTIKDKHKEEIDKWLLKAKESEKEKVFSYSKEEFEYYYAKGFKDAEVSFIYRGTSSKGVLKTTLIEGEKDDSVFITVNYNSKICCDGTGIEVN
jgi:hypothetical protein